MKGTKVKSGIIFGIIVLLVTTYIPSGGIGQIKITSTPLDATWIATEYANQNNPSGFVSIGPEEPGL